MQAKDLDESLFQVSAPHTRLAPGTNHTIDMVQSLHLQAVALPNASLGTEAADDKVIISSLNNVGLNLTMLPNGFLHTLQVGVIVEFRSRESCELSLMSEHRVNNEKMFTKNIEELQAKEKIQVQYAQLMVAMEKACRMVPNIHILEEEPLEAKIKELVAVVWDAKVEMARL